MRLSKEILATIGVVCLTSGVAMANCENADIQAYAHPTLFSAQGHSLLTGNTDIVTTGAKIYKPCTAKTVTGKENVIIGREAKKALNEMKNSMDSQRAAAYDPKSAVLRSELAWQIVTGLGFSQIAPNKYTDLADTYWAKTEIDKALAADVMIGYPDNTFKPDQAITKAEVFATFAKLMVVNHDASATPVYNGQEVKYIPNWAVGCTNEVIASGILEVLPEQDKIVNAEYLTREQVAYMISAMKAKFHIDTTNGAEGCATAYTPTSVTIKLSERLSARTSNVGDTFTAKTTDSAVVDGVTFPAGSTVKGVVTGVVRPGVKNPGYIEVSFKEISNDCLKASFPTYASSASVDVKKNPNIVSRLLASPVSFVARTAGVSGRTVATTAEVVSNGTEEVVDNLSDALCDTASLHPLKGLKSLGSGVIAIGKGSANIVKTVTTGVFGVGYELVDEVKYIIVPNTANDSSLNPDEVLTIQF